MTRVPQVDWMPRALPPGLELEWMVRPAGMACLVRTWLVIQHPKNSVAVCWLVVQHPGNSWLGHRAPGMGSKPSKASDRGSQLSKAQRMGIKEPSGPRPGWG